MSKFNYGCGNRAASFRIPTQVMADGGKGYIEDRRPSSNVDPYIVSAMIYDTGVLEESQAEGLIEHHKNWVEFMKGVTVESA